MIKKALSFFLFFLFLASFAGGALADAMPLPADQAFQFKKAYCKNCDKIITSWEVQPGYYLYKKRFEFDVINPVPIKLGKPQFPKTSIYKEYPTGEKMAVFSGKFTIIIPLIKGIPKADRIKLRVTYQGCSDLGICYPMQSKIATIAISGAHPTQIANTPSHLKKDFTKTDQGSEQDHLLKLLKTSHFFAILAVFFGFGLLLSLTPCVWPTIPILSSIILGQKNKSLKHAFGLSVTYVLAMSIMYGVLGAIAGLAGQNIQAALQIPWVIALFALVFVAMALSLFGLYNFQLPASLQNKLTHATSTKKRGTYISTAIMGCLSTLILSPCITPPLASAILFIGQQGSSWLGASALFAMGIGMGVPLLIIGTSSGKLLPKSGPWMNAIKGFLGVVMLGLAIWILERILPGKATMILWALLAIGVAVWMNAFSTTKTKIQHVCKIIGILLFIYGLIIFYGALINRTNPLQPLPMDKVTHSEVLNFKQVNSVAEIKAVLAGAKRLKKPVMLDFYASWCITCRELDAYTFSNAKVKALLKNYVLLRADVSANSENDKQMEKQFNVVSPPTILFFNTNAQEIKNSRIIGEISTNNFIKHLKSLRNDT